MSKLCGAIIPATRVVTGYEFTLDEEGEIIVDGSPPDGRARTYFYEDIPEAVCQDPATHLARSQKEVTCNLGGTHVQVTGEVISCSRHYVAGSHTDLSGQVTSTPVMAVPADPTA